VRSKMRMTRAFISTAALRVNVIASSESGPRGSLRAIPTKRSTSTEVLPAPAPAVTARSVCQSVIARARCDDTSGFVTRASNTESSDPTYRPQLAVATVSVAWRYLDAPFSQRCHMLDEHAGTVLHVAPELIRIHALHLFVAGQHEVVCHIGSNHSVAFAAIDAQEVGAHRFHSEQWKHRPVDGQLEVRELLHLLHVRPALPRLV